MLDCLFKEFLHKSFFSKETYHMSKALAQPTVAQGSFAAQIGYLN